MPIQSGTIHFDSGNAMRGKTGTRIAAVQTAKRARPAKTVESAPARKAVTAAKTIRSAKAAKSVDAASVTGTGKPGRPPKPRADDTNTPTRILLAAERLFAAHGIGNVSLREITSAAGVNSAAAHYHFGSKDAVLDELFALRARPIALRREELLSKVRLDRQGRPVLEDILRAFLLPALEIMDTPEGLAFTMLRARMVFEREEVKRNALNRAFDATNRVALVALAKALPKLSRNELYWRFHLMLGTMVYTMARPGRVESISHGEVDTTHPDTALDHLVRFAAAGFRAS
jgi:AcrR family transcriptional regulator